MTDSEKLILQGFLDQLSHISRAMFDKLSDSASADFEADLRFCYIKLSQLIVSIQIRIIVLYADSA